MTEKENPASKDEDRIHNEAPSEGDASQSPDTQRQHPQEPAEGDDADRQD